MAISSLSAELSFYRCRGPVEMPHFAKGSRCHKCYRCGSYNHLVSKCQAHCHNTKCTLCGSVDHKAKHCGKRVIGKGEDAVEEPSPFAQALETQEMSLLERSDWYLTSCTKCGRVDPSIWNWSAHCTRCAPGAVAMGLTGMCATMSATQSAVMMMGGTTTSTITTWTTTCIGVTVQTRSSRVNLTSEGGIVLQ
jgi:hypothetical protein